MKHPGKTMMIVILPIALECHQENLQLECHGLPVPTALRNQAPKTTKNRGKRTGWIRKSYGNKGEVLQTLLATFVQIGEIPPLGLAGNQGQLEKGINLPARFRVFPCALVRSSD